MNKEILARYKAGGIKALTDAECFEILSGKAPAEKNTTLREAIDNTDNPKVKLLKDIYTKYLEQNIHSLHALKSSKDVFDYLYGSMRGLNKEVFKVFYLTTQNKIKKIEDLFEGSLTSSSIYPREVVKSALKNNAAALIFVHNHPSGEPEPSEPDKKITENLVFAGQLMEIKILDHIIVGDNRYFSFADNGLIKSYEINARNNKLSETTLDNAKYSINSIRDNPLEKMISDINMMNKDINNKNKSNELER